MQITNGVYFVGIFNPNMRVFDVVMSTEYGTSYNAYIVKGENKTALIECSHKTFTDTFLENIKSVINPAEIDYIILNHCEPDHTGSLEELLPHMPNAQIIASRAGSIYIKNICNRDDLPIKVATDGEKIELGGKTLKFINAPFLHWPDSMFTYLEEEGVLFSCDFLGSHYCEPYILDSKIHYDLKYRSSVKNYYDAIFSPFKPYVLSGLDKIKDLDINFACVSHGPVLSKEHELDYVMNAYRTWSTPQKNEQPTIPIFYTSAYGNTKMLANAIAQGITSIIADAKIELFDIIDHDMNTLCEKLATSDAFALGTPTINRDALPPLWQLLSHVDAINIQKKDALVFGSYGWSGEGVPNIISRLKGVKVEVFEEGHKVLFVPSEGDLLEAKELGKRFAVHLEGKIKR